MDFPLENPRESSLNDWETTLKLCTALQCQNVRLRVYEKTTLQPSHDVRLPLRDLTAEILRGFRIDSDIIIPDLLSVKLNPFITDPVLDIPCWKTGVLPENPVPPEPERMTAEVLTTLDDSNRVNVAGWIGKCHECSRESGIEKLAVCRNVFARSMRRDQRVCKKAEEQILTAQMCSNSYCRECLEKYPILFSAAKECREWKCPSCMKNCRCHLCVEEKL